MYRWIRLPFGLYASSEVFQKHLIHALESLPGVLCIADDILIYGTGEIDEQATANHDKSPQDLLQTCKDHGIVLNPDKMKLRMSEVNFMGHLLTNKGLKPDPTKVEAITKMPKPQDVEGVQRLNGFVNYLAGFLPKLSEVMKPIRSLSWKDTSWNWSSEQDQVSNRSACSMILWPLTEPHYTMWCQPEWPWCSDTSEWQAYGVRKSFPRWYRNTLRSNREGDAGDCLRSWAFQLIHIWSTCIHRKWSQATRNNSTETICPNTSKPPVNDDAAIEIRFHRVLWARQKHTLGGHAVKGVLALQRQRSRRHRISQRGPISAHIWPASRRNKSRDPKKPVSARVVRDYSSGMAWKQGRRPSTDTPLLQHAWWPDRTRWPGLQREFRRDT